MRAKYLVNHEKILRAGDSFVGLAGWSASQDIFESLVREQPELLNFESRGAIFDSFRAMHEVMKEKYFIDTQEDKEQPVESSQVGALIVNSHGVYEMKAIAPSASTPDFGRWVQANDWPWVRCTRFTIRQTMWRQLHAPELRRRANLMTAVRCRSLTT